ncbi:MAG: hypothetical protein ACLRH0_11880 [Blautia wexlerae]
MHLILATQKPAGVVDSQISSNAKFRVCLKVQTRADSDEMLRRPEAAELKETGRFYLRWDIMNFCPGTVSLEWSAIFSTG